MNPLYVIEVEPEVRAWLESLPARHFLKVDEYVGLLAAQAGSLGEEAEVKRAMLAKKICETEHGPAHEEFVRIIEEGEIGQ